MLLLCRCSPLIDVIAMLMFRLRLSCRCCRHIDYFSLLRYAAATMLSITGLFDYFRHFFIIFRCYAASLIRLPLRLLMVTLSLLLLPCR